MKSQQHDEAKELFFQTNLSKTEIAQRVGVSRKTVLFWSHQGNWEKLRMSARVLPTQVAEKCFYLIDKFADTLVSETSTKPLSHIELRHAQTIHLLAATIKKLKNRSTVNESMEMFNFFLEGLNRRNPELAEQVAPEIENYITKRKNVESSDFILEGLQHDGALIDLEKENIEKWTDTHEGIEMMDAYEKFIRNYDHTHPNPQPHPTNEYQPTQTAEPERYSTPLPEPEPQPEIRYHEPQPQYV